MIYVIYPFLMRAYINRVFHSILSINRNYGCEENLMRKLGESRENLFDRLKLIGSTVSMKNAGHTWNAYSHRRQCDGDRLEKFQDSRQPHALFAAKIIHFDIPVDLLRRFSQPAGSSSSAIVVNVFLEYFAPVQFCFRIHARQTTSNTAHLHCAERRLCAFRPTNLIFRNY